MNRILIALVFLSLSTGMVLGQKPASHPTARPQDMRKTNRLAKEKSPYLRQHQHNPVDWWPWCEEAFAEARRRGVPVFLSIGYSTCHWCHVMEKESFKNKEIAALLNANFVCIKLDREERPDLDAVYMRVVQLLTRRGGWPATLFLTSDRKAFFGGTYFPPEQLKSLLNNVINAWKENREGLLADAQNILSRISQTEKKTASLELPSAETIDRVVAFEKSKHDATFGGFGGAPKFPRTSVYETLMRSFDEDAHRICFFSLKKIAHGGIYDHVGGGFHRYATDRAWLIPHFEKMLYDQALISLTLLEAGVLSGDAWFFGAVQDTLDCIRRDFTDPKGGLYCGYDADSGGIEGSFYVWTMAELKELFQGKELELVLARFNITEEGNWNEGGPEGANILSVRREWPEVAQELKLSLDETTAMWARVRQVLHDTRNRRTAPSLDHKILTGWNGLGISALAKGGRILNRPDDIAAAEAAARFVLDHMRDKEGRLLRRYCEGEAAIHGTLQDYAWFGLGLLDRVEATGDITWIENAETLADIMLRDFKAGNGALFDAPGVKDLVVRLQDAYDGARPSPNSMACLYLLRLHEFTGKKPFLEAADGILKVFKKTVEAAPWYYPVLMRCILARQRGITEIVVVSRPGAKNKQAVMSLVNRTWMPESILVNVDEETAKKRKDLIPLLSMKISHEGEAVVYVCENKVCQLPARTMDEVRKTLAAAVQKKQKLKKKN